MHCHCGRKVTGERAVSIDTLVEAVKIGCQIFGDPVGEIVLSRIAGEIGEGQHDDGQMRWRRWRVQGGDCIPVRANEIPGAGRDQYEQCREPKHVWRKRRTVFWLGERGLGCRLRLGGAPTCKE